MTDLIIHGESILHIYNNYVNQRIIVNRRYQRKLVWSIEQKEALIESILKDYPIPLILLTEIRLKGKILYEIMDGLQRLEAIVSFLDGDFAFQGQYFDRNTLPEVRYQPPNEDLPPKAGKKVKMNPSTCTAIINYELPVSIYRLENKARSNIDDIFLRVNTGGKQLTKQEIRQAAALDPFAQLVRRISSDIRGDVAASDILRLDQMKRISISGSGLDYGIKMDNIPWRRQNILQEYPIRQSQDEELVAHLLAYILLQEDANPSSEALDNYYNPEKEGGKKIMQEIQRIGTAILEQQILSIYDEVNKLLQASGYKFFSEWMFRRSLPRELSKFYQIVFLSLYKLLICDRQNITNYPELAKVFTGMGDSPEALRLVQAWNKTNRQQCIGTVVTMFQNLSGLLVTQPVGVPAYITGTTRVENIFEQCLMGQAQCYFQVSCYPLDFAMAFGKGEELFREIYKTATAIANHGSKGIGYIIIGASMTKANAEQYIKVYKNPPVEYKQIYITGVQDEAVRYYDNIIGYYNVIRDSIEIEPISPQSVKEQIARDIGLYNYKDKFVIILRVETPARGLCWYDNKVYDLKENGKLHELTRDEIGDFLANKV